MDSKPFNSKLTDKTTFLVAAGLLALMLGLAFFSVADDSATMDELAHIPAGYSYIDQQDMRLNPEHPPLLKDLAGLSIWIGSKITGQEINLPLSHKSWTEDINGQWDFGGEFLYRSGNPTDNMLLWSRLPMILITLLLGFYVFKWTREKYGNKAGLIALFLYSLSPTFLAHGRLVTTDVGAATAFFISAYYLVKWLKEQTTKNLVIAGFVFGLALLTKFSLALLIPYFIFLTVVWGLVNYKSFCLSLIKPLAGLFLIGLIALAIIGPVYLYHTWNYPPEKQHQDTQLILDSFGKRWMADPIIWTSDKPVIRAYGEFFLGLLMVIQRATGGNTTYFLGEISRTGWLHYFPVLFLVKIPLAFLFLAAFSLLYSIYQGIARMKNSRLGGKLINCVKNNFTEFALLSFFALYWVTTLRSNLNIGVRHILPTIPILYVLIGGQISQAVKNKRSLWRPLIFLTFIWYALGTVQSYPHFLAYFNQSVGGPSHGYKYVTDSNLDWGQDLKRLERFVQENNIEKIYVDYFGGDSVSYRLGDKFRPWWGDRDPNELPPDSWLAISATLLQGGRGEPVPGYNKKTGYYDWLNQYEPVKVIGHSIFVYHILPH